MFSLIEKTNVQGKVEPLVRIYCLRSDENYSRWRRFFISSFFKELN